MLNRTSRIGQAEQDQQNKKVDRQSRKDRTRQAEQERQNKTGRTELCGQKLTAGLQEQDT